MMMKALMETMVTDRGHCGFKNCLLAVETVKKIFAIKVGGQMKEFKKAKNRFCSF